jgi:hypothetical protein
MCEFIIQEAQRSKGAPVILSLVVAIALVRNMKMQELSSGFEFYYIEKERR